MHHSGMDTESVRARVVDAYPQGPDAVVALIGALLSELAAHLETVAARVATLEEENAALRAKLGTNSGNSSKPPSSDGPGTKPHPQSQRRHTGRKSGGQPGHEGHTLRLAAPPDEVVMHRPSQCLLCGHSLADAPAVRRARRQVVDLPPVRACVIEHQAETLRCPGCGATTSGAFPVGVVAPVQYGAGVVTLAVYLNQEQLLPWGRTSAVLAEVFGCPLSQGTLERAVAQCYEQLAATEAAITQGVTAAAVAHFDETGVTVGKTTAWLHVASTPRLTFYAVHPKRGRVAMDAIGVVPAFRGCAVHDGLTSYGQYADCAHALCNAHHLRELTFVAEQLGQSWAQDLKGVLGEIKQAVDDARGQGVAGLSAEVQREFARRYDAALTEGLRANPPPAPTGKRGRPKRGKAGCLVDRLREHKGATLAFMEDFAIPFDNNQAERDLRMLKTQQKVSGCFRSDAGGDAFARLRSYLSTLRKQGVALLDALQTLFTDTPLYPAFA